MQVNLIKDKTQETLDSILKCYHVWNLDVYFKIIISYMLLRNAQKLRNLN